MSGVAAIVLAAGRGTRFGSAPKLLTPLGGKPLVRHVAEAAVASLAAPVIVVTGHLAADIEAALVDLPVEIVRNPYFTDGLSTSLKAGFTRLPVSASASVILLGDMPLITTGLIDTLVERWQAAGQPSALVPTLNGRRGNPVVLSRELQDEIEELEGDVGAGPILRRRVDVVEWPTTDPAILQDVDTRDEISKLQPKR